VPLSTTGHLNYCEPRLIPLNVTLLHLSFIVAVPLVPAGKACSCWFCKPRVSKQP